MSIALVLVGLVVLIVGLPWLAAAVAFAVWGFTRCCAAAWPAQQRVLIAPLRRP